MEVNEEDKSNNKKNEHKYSDNKRRSYKYNANTRIEAKARIDSTSIHEAEGKIDTDKNNKTYSRIYVTYPIK